MTPAVEQRKNSLTAADLSKVGELIATALANQQATQHICRYHIAPEDMDELMKFIKSFKAAVDDSKSMARRWMIGMALAIISGLIGFNTWKQLK